MIAVLLFGACAREGDIALRTPAPPRLETPAPISLPAPPVRDETPKVWTASSGPVTLRIVMAPGRPIVGDLVRFDIKFTYGQPPYRPGAFNYRLFIDERFGEIATDACGVRTLRPGETPAPPRPFDDNLDRKYRFFRPGLHEFEVGGSPSCMSGAHGVSIKDAFQVTGPRALNGRHLTGADDTRLVDVVASPKFPTEWSVLHLYAIFEDRTGAPFGWRISFGDGRAPIVGGPACKPASAREGGRYERHYQRTFRHPAEYHVRVELSGSCLDSNDRRGRVVIDETVRIRPRSHLPRGFAYLPSHRYPPVGKTRLAPVRLEGDARTGCFWLERVSDGQRLQVLWPDGTSRLLKPLQVFSEYSSWRVGKVRKDVSILGVGPVDPVPTRCRFDDEALLLAPLPEPPPPKGR